MSKYPRTAWFESGGKTTAPHDPTADPADPGIESTDERAMNPALLQAKATFDPDEYLKREIAAERAAGYALHSCPSKADPLDGALAAHAQKDFPGVESTGDPDADAVLRQQIQAREAPDLVLQEFARLDAIGRVAAEKARAEVLAERVRNGSFDPDSYFEDLIRKPSANTGWVGLFAIHAAHVPLNPQWLQRGTNIWFERLPPPPRVQGSEFQILRNCKLPWEFYFLAEVGIAELVRRVNAFHAKQRQWLAEWMPGVAQ